MELYWLSASRGEWRGTPAPAERGGESAGVPKHGLTIPILCPARAKIVNERHILSLCSLKLTKGESLWPSLLSWLLPWSPEGFPLRLGLCSWGWCVESWPSEAVGLQLLAQQSAGNPLGAHCCPSLTSLCSLVHYRNKLYSGSADCTIIVSTQGPCSALRCEIHSPAPGCCRAGTCILFSLRLFSYQWCKTDNPVCALHPAFSHLAPGLDLAVSCNISDSLLLHGKQEAGSELGQGGQSSAGSYKCPVLCVIPCQQRQNERAPAQEACPSCSFFFSFAGVGHSEPAEGEHDSSTRQSCLHFGLLTQHAVQWLPQSHQGKALGWSGWGPVVHWQAAVSRQEESGTLVCR